MFNNGIELQSYFHNGHEVQTWYHNGKEVYSSGVVITYICNGITYTEKVKKGVDILHPTSFIQSKADSTFLGWSDSIDSTTPLTSKVADKDITLYAIFKYNDFAKSLAGAGGQFRASEFTFNRSLYATYSLSINPTNPYGLYIASIKVGGYESANDIVSTPNSAGGNISAITSSTGKFYLCNKSGYAGGCGTAYLTLYGKKVVG